MSKESTVLLWMLFKRVDQPSLVHSRGAPSLSVHFRIAKKTTSLSFATLPTLQNGSPAIGEILPVHPSSPRVVRRSSRRAVRRSSRRAVRRSSRRAVRRSSRLAPFVFRRVVRRVPFFRFVRRVSLRGCHFVRQPPGKLRNASRQTPKRTPCGVARAGPLS